MNPEVAVVIPMLNAAKTICDQLNAILTSPTSHTIEIVVADNGSSDDSRTLVEEISRHAPQVRLLDASDRNLGGAGAKNAGVESARASKILFADADDIVSPLWLDAMSRALDHYPIVAAKREYWSLNGELAQGALPEFRGQSVFDGVITIAGGAFGMHRDLYLRSGGFDEYFPGAVDAEFGLRLRSLGLPEPFFVEEAIVHCRVPTDARTAFRRAYKLALSKAALRRMYSPVIQDNAETPQHMFRVLAYRIRSGRKAIRSPASRLRWAINVGDALGIVVGTLSRRTHGL